MASVTLLFQKIMMDDLDQRLKLIIQYLKGDLIPGEMLVKDLNNLALSNIDRNERPEEFEDPEMEQYFGQIN